MTVGAALVVLLVVINAFYCVLVAAQGKTLHHQQQTLRLWQDFCQDASDERDRSRYERDAYLAFIKDQGWRVSGVWEETGPRAATFRVTYERQDTDAREQVH